MTLFAVCSTQFAGLAADATKLFACWSGCRRLQAVKRLVLSPEWMRPAWEVSEPGPLASVAPHATVQG